MRTATIAVLAAVVALPTAACSGQETSPPEPDPVSAPLIDEPDGLPDLVIADEPLWGSEQVPVLHPEVTFSGGLALVTGGPDEAGGVDIRVVEAASGTTLWSLSNLADLDGLDAVFYGHDGASLVGADEPEAVVVGYYSPDCVTDPCPPEGRQSPEHGVAGLDPRTGEALWSHPLVPSVDEETDARRARDLGRDTVRIASRSDDVPLVTVGPLLAPGRHRSPEQFRTVALRAADGEEIWTTEGVVAELAVDGTVIGLVPPTGPQRPLDEGVGGPVGLDLATGEERWNRSAELPRAILAGAAPSQVTLLAGPDHAEARTWVLDLTDGSVLHELTTVLGSPVVDGVTGMLAYATAEDLQRLTTLRPTDEEPGVSAAELDPGRTTVMSVGGYVLVHDRRADTTVAVDRSGTALSAPLPGQPTAVTDEYVVLRQGTGAGSTYAVHARRDR